MFDLFKRELDKIVEVECLEKTLVSNCDEFQYAGTVDCIATYEGWRCIIDYKTSSTRNIHPDLRAIYFAQLAAYRNAYNQMNPDTLIDTVIVFHVSSVIQIVIREGNRIDKYLDIFRDEFKLFVDREVATYSINGWMDVKEVRSDTEFRTVVLPLKSIIDTDSYFYHIITTELVPMNSIMSWMVCSFVNF